MAIERITGLEKWPPDYGLDEVVGRGVNFHIERMDDGHFWFSVSDGEREVCFWLYSKTKITVTHEDRGPPPQEAGQSDKA